MNGKIRVRYLDKLYRLQKRLESTNNYSGNGKLSFVTDFKPEQNMIYA